MSHAFEIIFDPLPDREARASRLDRVITPVDDFTGRIVTRGVSARVPREERMARRSLSGHLVFENLLTPAPLTVEIDAEAAGYFSPEPLIFPAPQVHDAPGEANIRVLRLILRPDRVIDGESAVIRGGVKRGPDWIAGADVRGRVSGFGPPADTREFNTRTDARGSFALRVRMPVASQSGGGVAIPQEFDVALRVREGANEKTRTVRARELQTVTVNVIDLAAP